MVKHKTRYYLIYIQWDNLQNSVKIRLSERARQCWVCWMIYLWGTADRGICYSDNDIKIFVYFDAEWTGDLDSRRSTTGYVVYAAGGPISWQLKLQSTIAVSTMEAEYMAALLWCYLRVNLPGPTRGVLSELWFDYIDPMILHMDSQSAMAFAKNQTHHKRSKHNIDIKYRSLAKRVHIRKQYCRVYMLAVEIRHPILSNLRRLPRFPTIKLIWYKARQSRNTLLLCATRKMPKATNQSYY
jgi:hypothetical protein